MTIAYYGRLDDAPEWVQVWLTDHPKFSAFHKKFVATHPHKTAESVVQALNMASDYVGWDFLEWRDDDLSAWIKIYNYEVNHHSLQ